MAKRITLGKPLGGFLAGAGLDELALAGGGVFFVNPGSGSDTTSFSDGKGPDHSFSTVTEALGNATAGKNDVVILVAQATADTPAVAIPWNKSYTHLIGAGGGSVSTAGRARIVGTAALDLAQVATFSVDGCIVKNIQFYNGGDAAAAAGAVVVSGSRNKFVNCHFAGMGDTGASAVAASYSLTVTGDENEFVGCTIGLDTVLRGASSVAEFVLGSATAHPARNVFDRCRFISYSETAGAFIAKIISADRYNIFRDCLFYNFSATGVSMTNAFNDTTETFYSHRIVLQGGNQLIGITGWSDTLTNIWTPGVNGAATYGVSLNPSA
jgi:hypothetical protein